MLSEKYITITRVCAVTAAKNTAFPPTRMAEVARGLSERGARTTMQSICANDYGAAVDAILERMAEPFTELESPSPCDDCSETCE